MDFLFPLRAGFGGDGLLESLDGHLSILDTIQFSIGKFRAKCGQDGLDARTRLPCLEEDFIVSLLNGRTLNCFFRLSQSGKPCLFGVVLLKSQSIISSESV